MKYGDTFHQRSIPEWQAYNVDYNDVKALIKDRTTRPGSSLIVVPGHREVAETDFEDELLEVLRDQHDNVNMFVRSKAGEMKRRLDHIHKIVVALRQRIDGSFKKIPVKKLERFSRAETDTLKVGQELQSLAQFLVAQKQAFRKLLKKYKKWTGSCRLELRFKKLQQSTVFTQADLDPLTAQYEDLLEALRTPFNNGLTWGVDAEERILPSFATVDWVGNVRDDSPAASLNYLCEHGSNLELDAGLATVALGKEAGHATYWVHEENSIQLHILMLQHAQLRGTRRNSTPMSPRKSASHEDLDFVMIDDAEEFWKRRSGTTIEEMETQPGRLLEEATACFRFGHGGDAIVELATTYERLRVHVQKKKQLCSLLTRSGGITDETLVKIEGWLKSSTAQPLARIRANRTRFIGLDNSNQSGVWATLDRDVTMQPCSDTDLFDPAESEWGIESFPHAILSIRWEGQRPEVVQMLDNSHLVERIPGFSLETHAIATLCKPDTMPAPFWCQALEKDIRKLPQKTRPGTITPESRPASTATSQPDPNSGFSNVPSESAATSVPDILEAPRTKRKKIRIVAPEAPRYWNEFDDGEEEEQDYAIYIDPDASEPLSEFWSFLTTKAGKLSKKFKQPDVERQPLLRSPSDSDSSPTRPPPARPPLRAAKYSTFPSFHHVRDPLDPLAMHQIEQRDTILVRCAAGSFLASYLLLIVAAVLEYTRRKKYVISADIGTMVGVIASVVFAITGMGIGFARDGRGGWTGSAQVGLAFMLSLVGNGIVVLLLLGS